MDKKSLEQLLNGVTIPGQYELTVSEIYALKEMLDIPPDAAPGQVFWETLLPVYKLGFVRGMEFARKKEKNEEQP